jgi:hypothetical protein
MINVNLYLGENILKYSYKNLDGWMDEWMDARTGMA